MGGLGYDWDMTALINWDAKITEKDKLNVFGWIDFCTLGFSLGICCYEKGLDTILFYSSVSCLKGADIISYVKCKRGKLNQRFI